MRQGFGGRHRRAAVAIAKAAVAVGTVAVVYAYAIEPRRLQQRRFRVGVAGLPAELCGVRIAHLTDFHVGMAGTRRSTLRRAVAVATAWRPDIVALTGDFVHDGRWDAGAHLFAGLARMAPTFAVLGNHDHAASPAATGQIVGALQEQGVVVLRNAYRVLSIGDGGAEIVIVAVDDPSLGHADLAAAMAGLPEKAERDRPSILLGHAPEIVDEAPPNRFALTLAGHTHGGQLRLSPFKRRTPLELPMIVGRLNSPYPRGTRLVRGNPLFVNSGLGVSGVPFRFLAPPQVACFTLECGPDLEKPDDDPARFFTHLPD